MDFVVEGEIERPPTDVFAFLRDVHLIERDPHSIVPVLRMTTPGPVGVGSCFEEQVRVLPFARAHVASRITRYEPPAVLDYAFSWRLLGMRMTGELAYRLLPTPLGTRLRQVQTLEPHGPLVLFRSAIRRQFQEHLDARMVLVKEAFEA